MAIDDELLRVLDAATSGRLAFRSAPQPVSGGYWAAIYGFELAGAPPGWTGPLIARLMPNPTAAAKEIVVQTTLAELGFSTPEVLASGIDDGLGGAYMVMRRAEGRSPLTNLEMPKALPSLPRVLRELPRLLAGVALQLHAVDPQPINDALAAAGVDLPSISEAGYFRSIEAAVGTSAAGFGDLLEWLRRHQPTVAGAVVCHGDLHPMNLLVTDEGGVTVLDWTNANLLPREFDVGFTAAFLRCAPISVPRALQPVVRRLTNRLAEDFIARYADEVAIDRRSLEWFEAWQHARCLAEVALGRTDASSNIGPRHPFETSSQAMIRRLASITAVTVSLPLRSV